MTTQIAVIVFMLIEMIGAFCFFKVFKKAIVEFLQLLTDKLYFLVCTKKGKALSKEDFETIKQVNKHLYLCIEYYKCLGYCYSSCFEICKALKKGAIELVAVKGLLSGEDNDGKKFQMHVLYINNGWAFDTTSLRQYPIEKLHEIYKAKIYKTFSFDEISMKSYEEFRG